MSRSDAFAKTGRTAVQQNIQGTLEFLQKYPPFNQMDIVHLSYLIENCQLRFYSEGEKIISPEDGPVEFFISSNKGVFTVSGAKVRTAVKKRPLKSPQVNAFRLPRFR